MSKYKPYPQYKDSGVEWLGEIPEQWESLPLKYLLSKIIDNRGRTPSFGDNGIPMLEIRNITKGIKTPTLEFEKFVPQNIVKEYERDKVKSGDLLISTVGATSGKTVIIQEKPNYFIAQNIVGLRVNTLTLAEYLYYFLCSDYFFTSLMLINKGNTIDNLKVSVFINNTCFLPSLQEQQTISTYLDKATVKIDTLIEKQTKLIALLKEKRQAVISTAVTRGLDSSVPMKESGVEWLGEIPEHWAITPLRYIGRLQNGISKGGSYFGSGFPFVNYGDIYKNGTLPLHVNGLAKSSIEDRHAYSVQKGDVFFTRTSETIDDIGMASTCLKTIENATFSGFTIRFRQLKKVLNENFSKYYFRTGKAQAFFEEQLNLVTRASLGQDILKQLPVILPSLIEQQSIADYLDNKTTKIDNLITKATKAIELLKERRIALISAVVTGKIDVRSAG